MVVVLVMGMVVMVMVMVHTFFPSMHDHFSARIQLLPCIDVALGQGWHR